MRAVTVCRAATQQRSNAATQQRSNAATQQRSNADRPSPCKRLLKAVHPPPQRGSAQPHKTWSGGRLPACLLRSTASPSPQGQHAAQLAADVQHARCEVTAQPVSIANRFESPRLCASQLGLRRSCEGAAKTLRTTCAGCVRCRAAWRTLTCCAGSWRAGNQRGFLGK